MRRAAVVVILLVGVAACRDKGRVVTIDSGADSSPPPPDAMSEDASTMDAATLDAADGGRTARSPDFLRLANEDERCKPCIFDGRCKLGLAQRDFPGRPCCDYSAHIAPRVWKVSGHAAKCMAERIRSLDVDGGEPRLPPFAREGSGERCFKCTFDAKCTLMRGSTKVPCCDLTGGKDATQNWSDDAKAANCLAAIWEEVETR